MMMICPSLLIDQQPFSISAWQLVFTNCKGKWGAEPFYTRGLSSPTTLSMSSSLQEPTVRQQSGASSSSSAAGLVVTSLEKPRWSCQWWSYQYCESFDFRSWLLRIWWSIAGEFFKQEGGSTVGQHLVWTLECLLPVSSALMTRGEISTLSKIPKTNTFVSGSSGQGKSIETDNSQRISVGVKGSMRDEKFRKLLVHCHQFTILHSATSSKSFLLDLQHLKNLGYLPDSDKPTVISRSNSEN